jgi:hypothetical protein
MMVDERVLPHPDAVMKGILRPSVIRAMGLRDKELVLNRFQVREHRVPQRRGEIVE